MRTTAVFAATVAFYAGAVLAARALLRPKVRRTRPRRVVSFGPVWWLRRDTPIDPAGPVALTVHEQDQWRELVTHIRAEEDDR